MGSAPKVDIPPEFRPEADALPPVLRALLDAELAAGNKLSRLRTGDIVPPVGAFLLFAQPVTTRPRESGEGIRFQDWSKLGYPGSFTDDAGVFYLFEPFDASLYLDTDAVREAHNAQVFHPTIFRSDPASALGRFERSTVIDYTKWHDGAGYDIDALKAATAEERIAMEALLLEKGVRDWRDVEALAALGTPRAMERLARAADDRNTEIRLAVFRYAENLISQAEHTKALVRALQTETIHTHLSQALDWAEVFHPAKVVDALFEGVLKRDGETACHFAALLMYLHGEAKSAFDWDLRPFFLRFLTEDRGERTALFRELCEKIHVERREYL